MKFFAVLALCLAVANARPDVSGYAYPKPPAGFNNENYIAQPPLVSYTGDASNTQFLTVPGKTTVTTVTRGGGFDGGNTFSSGGGGSTFPSGGGSTTFTSGGGGSTFQSGGGGSTFSSGGGGSSFPSGGGGSTGFSTGGGGNSFTTGVIGGSGPAIETIKTVTTTRTDGGNFGSVSGLDSGINKFTSSGSIGGPLSGGSVTTNEYTTIGGGAQGFGVQGSTGSGSLGGGGQTITTNQYTTGGQGSTGVRGSFGTGSLGGGGAVTTNEYTTVQGGSQGFGLGGQIFTSGGGGGGSLDGRFGQQTITNLGGGSANFAHERTRYVNVQTEYVTKAPIVTKSFYVHAAPEDDEQVVARQRIHVPAPQKHYKIIFIKAPQPIGYNAAAIPPPVQNEEKTIVYVLVKKPDGSNQEIEIPAPPPTPPAKPEVYFIKYKGKDATQTIQTIQNQYANQGVTSNGYTGSGITSGFIPGGSSNTFTSTKTSGRFGGDDGVQLTGTGGTGSTSFTTNTVSSGGNNAGVQYVASAPTGGSFTTTKTVTTGGSDGGVQYVSSVPTGSTFTTTKTVTSGGNDGGVQFVSNIPSGGSTSYTTKTVTTGGGDGGSFVASVPTGGVSYTTGGDSGFGTGLRFGGDGSSDSYSVSSGPVSGSTYTTKTITSEQVGGGDSGFNVLRFGGTSGIEGAGSGSTTFTASAPTHTSFTTKTVQVPSSTYEYISGSTTGTLGQTEDCCGGSSHKK